MGIALSKTKRERPLHYLDLVRSQIPSWIVSVLFDHVLVERETVVQDRLPFHKSEPDGLQTAT